MKRPTPSAAVGFATLVAFVLFLGFTFAIRGNLFGGSMELQVLFESVSGLEVGSPVYVAGVHTGAVTKISYQPGHMGKPVIVTISLNKNLKFYRNAKVQIVQLGLIGDKRLEIDPGTAEQPLLSDGEALDGLPQLNLDESLKQGQQIVTDLAVSIRSLRDLITDEANLGAIRNTLQSLEQSIKNLSAILEENRKNILDTTTNVREATARVGQLLDKADMLVTNTDKNIAETRASVDRSLQEIQNQFDRVGASFERLTEQLGTTADQATSLVLTSRGSVEPLLAELRSAAENLNAILVGVHEGRGTLGQIVNNPSPFIELDRTLRALRQTLLGRSGIEASVDYEPLGTDPDTLPVATPNTP